MTIRQIDRIEVKKRLQYLPGRFQNNPPDERLTASIPHRNLVAE
jgi:hypothetical protein